MEARININDIRKFWDWFSENCQSFGSNFENAALLEQLDVWVTKLGNFSWEVGPGKVKDNALVISPNGDLELLQGTKEIISNAKECTGWEYYYAKPPKQWDLIFDFETNDGAQVRVNASQWEYVLLKYDDGMFEIIIKSPQLKQLDGDDKLTAAEIVLDGILGEETRMQAIEQIDMVNEFEQQYKNKAGNINELSDHLQSLKD